MVRVSQHALRSALRIVNVDFELNQINNFYINFITAADNSMHHQTSVFCVEFCPLLVLLADTAA